ncbi:MAG: hypothetical protein ACRD1L_01375 [Terriglobales bacterium]
MPDETPFQWIFRAPLPEQTGAFTELARGLAARFGSELDAATHQDGLILRSRFGGASLEAEERGRAFWLELHSRCLDQNLAMELVQQFDPPAGWRPLEALAAITPAAPAAARAPHSRQLGDALSASGRRLPGSDARPQPDQREGGSNQGWPCHPAAMAPQRPPIPEATLYEILRGDDPEMDRNLVETIAWIEAAGLPVINLLSYLELPLYVHYAAAHPGEREQNLFLHMLHTWTCYRRWGEVHARMPEALAQAFTDPRYLRLNTTQFRSPAPALCVQLAPWSQPVGATGAGPAQWAKEIYLTHLEPPTPFDDRELTLMIVTHDARGEFGFFPLEVPLSLPGVGDSLEAFFAPSAGDVELGANTRDLHRLTAIAATYCLYASARDPARYLL